MNTDLFNHLDDILNSLEEIKAELNENINNVDLHHQVSEELEDNVLEPLLTSIESLSNILESVQKFGDAESMYDPYNEGLE
jgi:hypothetical protein